MIGGWVGGSRRKIWVCFFAIWVGEYRWTGDDIVKQKTRRMISVVFLFSRRSLKTGLCRMIEGGDDEGFSYEGGGVFGVEG